MRISDWSSDVCSSDLSGPGIIDIIGIFRVICGLFLHPQSIHDKHLLRPRFDAAIAAMHDQPQPMPARCQRGAVEARTEADIRVRSEERREGKECVSTCSYRRAPSH